ncbi:MAG: peptidase MA family metallohydrolase [Dehalococcoidia bacterium]
MRLIEARTGRVSRRWVPLVVATLALLAALASLTTASAQVDVRASNATSDFPNGVSFTLDASVPGGADEVRLIYQILPDGVRATAVPDCTGATAIGCNYQLASNQQNFLIPGAEIEYFWRITTGDQTEETDAQRVAYEDDRFDWQTIADGNLTLWYYDAGDDEAQRILAAGRESLDRNSALLQTTVDFPVKIFYYASAEEMQPAIISSGAEGVVTLGEVVYSDTAMVSADFAPEEITRHEIAHVVVRQAVREPYDVPAWLNEGTAVFAQSEPSREQRGAVENAIASGDVLSVRSLSSLSNVALANRVSLFYGESWSLVSFLVETYGEEQFAQLFAAYAGGATTADALDQVYGFNQDGLENAWRASVGLPPRAAPTPDEAQVETPAVTTPEGTAASGSDGDDGAPIALLAGIGVLTILLAGALLATGVLLARRYR